MDDFSLFEYCLARLEAGEDLESVLAQFPDRAGNIRPPLTAALEARRSGEPVRIPASAKIDSRTRFLAEAGRMQSRQAGFQPRFRLAGAIAIAIFVLFAGLFGTGLASAEAVPGETLYPVKRVVEKAQLVLTTNQVTKLGLEEEFDRRRVAETEKLKAAGRSEPVTLAGTLNESTEHAWNVGGVQLNLSPEQLEVAQSLRGSYVEVEGRLEGANGLTVETLELRLFNISGILESMDSGEWIVSGVKVLVMEDTQITGKPAVGRKIAVTTLHYNEDYFLALSVRVLGNSSTAKNQQNQQDNNGKDSDAAATDDEKLETPSPSKSPEATKTEDTKSAELHETDDDHQVTLTVTPDKTRETEEVDD